MRRILFLIFVTQLMLLFAACSESAQNSWQQQYDLGVRYLSDGNYEEAIIAFTAAIEIEPKRAEAYVGRGDAYIGLGETENNLTLAQADYEQAIELDEANAGAYLGLADVYIRQGDYDKALEILRAGLEKTGDNADISAKIAEIEAQKKVSYKYERENIYGQDGTLLGYTIYEYDAKGSMTKSDSYMADGTLDFSNSFACEYDAKGQEIRVNEFDSDGNFDGFWTNEYDEKGHKIRQNNYDADGTNIFYYFTFEYDSDDHLARKNMYWDGSLQSYDLIECNAEGLEIMSTPYDADGTAQNYYMVCEYYN